MKIKLSQNQWKQMGKKAGWIDSPYKDSFKEHNGKIKMSVKRGPYDLEFILSPDMMIQGTVSELHDLLAKVFSGSRGWGSEPVEVPQNDIQNEPLSTPSTIEGT